MVKLKKFLGIILLMNALSAHAHPYYLDDMSSLEENACNLVSVTGNSNLSDYESKLAKIASTIPLEYNGTVRSYIELYVNRSPALSEKILSLSDIYFPIFEKTLRQYGLPLELKYLPVTESALNATAVSRAGATGLWQIMPATAKGLKLNVDSYVDERIDPYKSSDAAIRYLKSLYNKYEDWLLVIAAYNCGPGKVDEAVRRSGGITNYWLLYDYLPKETRNYVPAFISCVYWMHYHMDHSLRIYPHPYSNLFPGSDTVMVNGPLHLNSIAKSLSLDVEKLSFINPALKKRFLPDGRNQYCLRLPVTEIYAFKQKRASIILDSRNQTASGNTAFNSADVWHTVKKGETLSGIADKYKCKVADLKKWNNLKNNSLKIGAKLKVGLKSPASLSMETTSSIKTELVSNSSASSKSNSTDSPDLTAKQPETITFNQDNVTITPEGYLIFNDNLQQNNDLGTPDVLKDSPATITQNELEEEEVIITPEGDILIVSKGSYEETSLRATASGRMSMANQTPQINPIKNESGEEEVIVTPEGDILIVSKDSNEETFLRATASGGKLTANQKPPANTIQNELEEEAVIITPEGDILIVSKGSSEYASSVADDSLLNGATEHSNDPKTYTVQKGDSFWSIAKQFPDVTIEHLLDLNGLNKKSVLKPGMDLVIRTNR